MATKTTQDKVVDNLLSTLGTQLNNVERTINEIGSRSREWQGSNHESEVRNLLRKGKDKIAEIDAMRLKILNGIRF